MGEPGFLARFVQAKSCTAPLSTPEKIHLLWTADLDNWCHLQILYMAITVNSHFFLVLGQQLTIIKCCTQATHSFNLDKMFFWVVTLKCGPPCFEHLQNSFYEIIVHSLTSHLQWTSYENHPGGAFYWIYCGEALEKVLHCRIRYIIQSLTDSEHKQEKLVPKQPVWFTLMENVININSHFIAIALTHRLSEQPTFISHNMKFLLLYLLPGVISLFPYLDFSFICSFSVFLCLYAM